MAVLETEFEAYDNTTGDVRILQCKFNPGQTPHFFDLYLGGEGIDKEYMAIDKTDATILRDWLNSILVIME